MTIRNNQEKTKESSHNNAIKVEARSIEQALVKAAGILGVTQDELNYEILKEDAPKGLFSFFKTPSLTIMASIKKDSNQILKNRANTTHQESRKETSRKNSRSGEKSQYIDEDEDQKFGALEDRDFLPPEKVELLTEELKEFCGGIIQRISGQDPKISATIEEGRLIITSDNEYLGQQISKNTKLAEAMEHILRKKPRHLKQELPFRIFVDVGGMRRKREEELVQMALDLSIKVHENKKPIVLNYKSSYDRKIIHMALDKDERVYTKSIGSGPNRKLMILPNKYNQSDSESTNSQAPQIVNVE
jgi:spoIIIJ-associated protein